MATTDDPHVLLPVDAVRIDPWESSDGTMFRYFAAVPRGEHAAVQLAGFQRADGTVYDLTINVDADEPLTVAATEELVANLTAALADVRRLAP
ncbi:hypothetical protein AB0876_31780 [Mycobacterium sp. NPDC049093]